ncbi:hypothetical protein DEJ48_02780 [Streptomyces venezuelae]|uniref:Uncharacterized protein n=1 Tax=Streptomyces venezuelae TaxID=54571 RepID=A0A5P2BVL1_STRVZ|nr:hypothetical protein DEJ48_02780 [Streptomyces venezuelae]
MTRDGKTYLYVTYALGSVFAFAFEPGQKVNTYPYKGLVQVAKFLARWVAGDAGSHPPKQEGRL